MEIAPIFGSGGRRITTPVNSSGDTEVDLTAYDGHYVMIYSDQALFVAQVSRTGKFQIDPTLNADVGPLPPAPSDASKAKVMFRRIPATTYVPVFVVRSTGILLLRAQSTSTTYVEFVVGSLPQHL